MSDQRPLATELHHEIEQFLYREARMLDGELLREWLEDVLDPEICYQMVIREERFRKDKSPAEAKQVMPYDDDHTAIELRIRQVETGLRTMLDPPERLRRFVSNIETYHGDQDGHYRVYSYGIVSRNRRLYEREQFEFGREDVLKRGQDGKLRLLSRMIEVDQRVVQGKNLLFFL